MSKVIGFRISNDLFKRIKNSNIDIREIMRRSLMEYISMLDASSDFDVNKRKQGVNSIENEKRYQTLEQLVDEIIKRKTVL